MGLIGIRRRKGGSAGTVTRITLYLSGPVSRTQTRTLVRMIKTLVNYLGLSDRHPIIDVQETEEH